MKTMKRLQSFISLIFKTLFHLSDKKQQINLINQFNIIQSYSRQKSPSLSIDNNFSDLH